MGRGKAWFPEADLHLAHAWVAASDDPIVGNYQDGKTFWQSVQAAYSKLSATNEERSKQGLQGRWADINKKVTKFNGTYLQLKKVQRSGYNEEKYVEDALALFLEEEGERFTFLSCWQYLKDKPKWVGNGAPKKKEAKKAAVKQEQKLPLLPAADRSVVCEIDDCGVEEGAEEVASRPIGQKKAKELRNSSLRQLEIDEKTARAMESRAETHKLQVEFKLMNSLGDCPAAKEWKELMAEEILLEKKKKLAANKRAIEAQEAREKRKKQLSERLQKEVTPTELSFDEDKENASPTFSSLSTDSTSQQKVLNVCAAGDYCVVTNGHKVACTQLCRWCNRSCHFNCCTSDDYNFKTCRSCAKEREIEEEEEEIEQV